MKTSQVSQGKSQALTARPFGKDPVFWASLLPGFRKALADLKSREAENIEGVPATSASDAKGPISEAALECLISAFPAVLPWEELGLRGQTPCVLGRNIKDGPATDLLLLESWNEGAGPESVQGRLVIVETKLVKNAEIYRAVLGQVLQYAAELSCEPQLLEKLKALSATRKLLDLPGVCDAVALDRAAKAARMGDIRLLIVSDEIPGELARAISFVPKRLISAIEVIVASSAAPDARTVALSRIVAQGGELEGAARILEALRTPAVIVVSGFSDAKAQDGVITAQAHAPRGPSIPKAAGWDPEEVEERIRRFDPAFAAFAEPLFKAFDSFGKLGSETPGLGLNCHGRGGIHFRLEEGEKKLKLSLQVNVMTGVNGKDDGLKWLKNLIKQKESEIRGAVGEAKGFDTEATKQRLRFFVRRGADVPKAAELGTLLVQVVEEIVKAGLATSAKK